MTHDPLCVCSRKGHAHFFYTIPADMCMACKCEDIARVRADEREQAAQRVESAHVLTPLLTTKETGVVRDAMRMMAAAARGET